MKDIIRRVQAGDQEAFEQLYYHYADRAIRVATAITSSSANAADAVQETFIRVYKNIRSYDTEKPFQPWFNKILVNECNRYMKKNARIIPVEINEERDLPPEEDTYDFEEYEGLYEKVLELDELLRVPLVLKYQNDHTEQEIAAILDLNVNTVKSRLFKGRRKLRERLMEAKGGIYHGS